jgi:hypothetical protein
MTRITTTILIITVLLNGTATIMEASGLNDDLGVEIQTGVDDRIDAVVDNAQEGFDPNTGAVESFVLIAVSAGNAVATLLEGVFTAPTLISNLLGGSGVVDAVVTAFFAPMYIISTLEIISIVVGNRTV